MRPLPVLVCVEAVVLTVLFVLWFQRPGGERPASAAQRPVTPASVVPDAGPSRTGSVPRVDAAAPDPRGAGRSQVVPDGGERAVADLVVRGRILCSEGSEPPESPYVSFHRAGRNRRATVRDGQYAAAGLSPGVWEASVREDGWARSEVEVLVTGEPVQTVDLTVTPAARIEVFLTAADGTDLQASLNEFGLHWGLNVVATAEPLSGDLPVTDNASVGGLGLGQYRASDRPGGEESQNGESGVLWLDRQPPVHVAVLMRHLVLSQQTVAAGQSRVTFAIDTERLASRFPNVSLRVVDGVTGKALTENVRVSLGTAQGGGGGRVRAVGDRLVVDHVMPGLAQLELMAPPKREHVIDTVLIPEGAEHDLGDFVVHPQRVASGRLVGAGGEPSSGSLQWTCLDLWEPPAEQLIDRRSTTADADGAFQLWGVGPHRYVVTASGPDRASRGHAVIDAGALSETEPFEVRLRPSGTLSIEAPKEALRAWVAVVLDEDRVPVAVRPVEPRFPRQSVSIAEGRWTVEVYEVGSRGVVGDAILRREVEVVAGEIVRLEVE